MSYSQFEKVGIVAVDIMAECVAHYRAFFKPLKTIYLKPRYYEQFRSWLQFTMKEAYNPDQLYQFDGVNIERGSNLQLDALYVDFYPENVE